MTQKSKRIRRWLQRALAPIGAPSQLFRGVRLGVEQLQDRITPTVSLSAALVGGDLVIADIDAVGRDDNLTIVVNGANFIVSDATEQFVDAGGISGASLSNGNTTLTVPIASIDGNLIVNAAAGMDTLTVDFTGGSFDKTISYNGGDPTSAPGDKLVILGDLGGIVTYNSTNANDGSVVSSHFGTVNYTGVEQVVGSGAVTDIVVNLPAGTNAVTLGDDDTAPNVLSRLSGGTIATTDFANPTGTLTINRASAADTVAVNALPDFSAGLAIGSSSSPFSTITFGGAVTLANGKNLDAYASGTIGLPNATSALATSGTGTISLTTAQSINLGSGASVTTADGGITLSANQQATATSGNFVGINLAGAAVQTTGAGTLTLQGRGGDTGGLQYGVQATGSTLIASGGTASLTIKSDSVNIDATSTIRAGAAGAGTANFLTLPHAAATLINLGGADVLTGSPLTLGLATSELGRVTAAALNIGSNAAGASSGTLTVTADIVRSTATAVQLLSGADIVVSTGQINNAGGTLKFTPGPTSSVKPTKTSIDATANTSFTSGSNLTINVNGTAVDSSYSQLRVIGSVNLTGVNLVLTGTYAPVTSNSFTIVSATSLTGTFNGLAAGALVMLNGVPMSISYTASTVTLTRVANGSWAPLTNLIPDADGASTMLLLPDGTVLVQGGAGFPSSNWYKLTPTATGSYTSGTFTQVASSIVGRAAFPSNILPDGRIFFVGGEYSDAGDFTNTGEIYDPVADLWTPIANFPQSEFGDDPTQVLSDGTILAGYVSGPQTYLYHPTTDTWTPTGTKLRNDESDEETWIKLAPTGMQTDGDILSVDVFNDRRSQRYQSQSPVTGLPTNIWIDSGTLPVSLTNSDLGFEMGPGFRLQDGRAFQIGANSSTAIYTPATNSWVTGPTIPGSNGCDDAPGVMLPNGNVLFLADTYSPLFSPPTHVFDYNPFGNTITQEPLPSTLSNILTGVPAYFSLMLMLPNGHALLSDETRQIWEYTPALGNTNPALAPTISSIVANGNSTYALTGTQLNGVSEGAVFGDDDEMSTNYPIVQLTSGSGNVYYARTFNWSRSAVATGSTPVTTQFALPAGLPAGTYSLVVSANGIASAATTFVNPTTVNTPPSITSNGGAATAAANVPENSIAVTTVTATDPDAGTTLVYTISGGADAAKFTIDGTTHALSFIVAPNFEAPTDVGGDNVYNVTVQVSDGMSTDTQAIAVTVTDMNEPPTITSNGGGPTAFVNVPENSTAVTTVIGADADFTSGFTVDHLLSSTDVPKTIPEAGTVFSSLTISGVNGVIDDLDVIIVNLQHTYDGDIYIRLYDPAGAYVTLEQNEGSSGQNYINTRFDDSATTPIALGTAPFTGSFSPDSPLSAFIGQNPNGIWKLQITDVLAPDGGVLNAWSIDFKTPVLHYAIAGGADASKFQINQDTGALSFLAAPNFEAPTDVGADNVYNVIVQASDGSLTGTQALAVTVTNVDEPPTSIGLTPASVPENQPLGTAVGTLNTTDIDVGDTFTYTLVSGTGSADNGSFAIVGGQLQTAATFDFETRNSYSVRVRSIDSGGLFTEGILTINITDANDAPTIVGGEMAAFSIPERTTAVATIVAADQDAGSVLTCSLLGDDAALFAINPITHALSFTAAPDFESPGDADHDNIYRVTMQVSDNGTPVLSATQAVTVTVTDVPIVGTNTVLASQNLPTTGGLLVSFQATVSAVSGAATEGLVAFNVDGAVAFTAPVNSSGVAVFTTSSLTYPATHAVLAAYLGTPDFAASTSNTLSAVINNVISLVPGSGPLPAATLGVGYLQTIVSINGTGAKTYAITSGNLPTGLSLNPATGALFGTPTVGGTFSFQITATDTVGAIASGAYSIAVGSPVPTVVNVAVNGQYPGLLPAAQRSIVASLVVTFNEPVQLDANALSIALHTSGVHFGGVAGAVGSVPTNVLLSTSDNIIWVVTFDGNTDPLPPLFPAPADGLQSLQDGVYDFNIDASRVHPVGQSDINGAANSTTVFYRLFGDVSGENPASGNIHSATVNTIDNLAFRAAFNTSSADSNSQYKAYFDFDGDGQVNTADNFQFHNRFNRPLTWSA